MVAETKRLTEIYQLKITPAINRPIDAGLLEKSVRTTPSVRLGYMLDRGMSGKNRVSVQCE
jgi:hypothetical protein